MQELIYGGDITYMAYMRILVDMTDEQLQGLAALSEECKQSRAGLIRQAVDELLSRKQKKGSFLDLFGIWKDRDIDGLEYQERIRSEW